MGCGTHNRNLWPMLIVCFWHGIYFLDTLLFGIVVPQGDSREMPNMDNMETLPFGLQSPNLNEDPIVAVQPEPPAAQPDPSSGEEEMQTIPQEKTPEIKTLPVSPNSTLKDILSEEVECLEFVLSWTLLVESYSVECFKNCWFRTLYRTSTFSLSPLPCRHQSTVRSSTTPRLYPDPSKHSPKNPLLGPLWWKNLVLGPLSWKDLLLGPVG